MRAILSVERAITTKPATTIQDRVYLTVLDRTSPQSICEGRHVEETAAKKQYGRAVKVPSSVLEKPIMPVLLWSKCNLII